MSQNPLTSHFQATNVKVIILFALVTAMCTGPLAFVPDSSAIQDPSDPRTMPLLSPGQHTGFATYVPIEPGMESTFDDRVDEMTEAGLDIARVLINWSEIEVAPGEYDLSLLEEQLEAFDIPDLQVMLTLGVTDSIEYSIPSDLQESELVLNQPIDDPAVIERYLDLLDAVLPALMDNSTVFLLSVANEPNAVLEERPREEAEALGRFLSKVRDDVHENYSGLAVTLTLASDFNNPSAPEWGPLIDPMDVMAINVGCLDGGFEAALDDSVPTMIELLLEVADGRQIVLQELSCASGWLDRPSDIGATTASQAAWFEAFFTLAAAEPQIRAVYVLDLIDWPDSIASIFGDAIRAEGLIDIGNRYQEFLVSWGLLTTPDLTPKPAWDVFIAQIASQSEAT